MKPNCEAMVRYVLPAIRAMIARDLIEGHNMTQKEAAKKLGMTQPAVSQYGKHIRGNRAKILERDQNISDKISKISNSLARGEIDINEATDKVCEICKYMRKKGLVKKII